MTNADANKPNERIFLSLATVTEAEEQAVVRALHSGWVAPLGPEVDAFEAEIANRCGVEHALALSSGTAGLHLALLALGIGEGDYIPVSTMTFAATTNAIAYVGATPVFVDAAEDGNIDPELLLRTVDELLAEGKSVPAVMIVDLFGRCADYPAFAPRLEELGIALIEDAAEALGASVDGQPAGSFGRAAALSFNGNKIITTSGGGMLLTCEKALRDRAFFLATQARDAAPWYQHSQAGYNYRMSNIAAAIGVGQIKHLDERVTRRRAVYHRYCRELADLPVTMMPVPDGCRTSAWLSCLTIDRGQRVTFMDLYNALNDAGIETRPLWKPMHLQPVFSGCPCFNHGGSSVWEDVFGLGLCLPSASAMSADEQSRVIEALKSAF